MLTGLIHGHKSIAYLLFLVALVDLVLALTRGRTHAPTARLLRFVHGIGLMGLGRLTLVLGLVMLFVHPAYGPGTWWAWSGVVLWGPIEVAAKRLVKPELQVVADGGQASGRLVLGTLIQLVCITVVFGLMSARP